MKEATITPGPWLWLIDRHHATYRVCDKQYAIIATVNAEEHTSLIAAAPDLLKELEYVVEFIEDIINGKFKPDSFTIKPARNAIDKAKFKGWFTSQPDVCYVTRDAWENRQTLIAKLVASAQRALDYLTDHGIDLDGEAEELVAGIRLELDEAIQLATGKAAA